MGVVIALFFLVAIGRWVRPKEAALYPDLVTAYNTGLFVRVIGTGMYLIYAYNFSGGSVDAFIYDNYAARFAEYFARWDFSPFTEQALWRNGQLFYTNFVAYPAAFFLLLTFNSTFGIYLLFSLACFIGLVFMWKAFIKNYPGVEPKYLSWLLYFFPALWFWTSTIGKDAFIFLGMGLVCLGIGRNGLNYLFILLGLAIIYAFRPPTAYIVLISLSAFLILNTRDSFFMRLIKIGGGTVLLLYALSLVSTQWGVEELSNESVTELQNEVLRNNNYGTGALEQKTGGFESIPRGVIDVLARPFIWEANNVLTLASAIEINFVVVLLIVRRRSVALFLRYSLENRLSTFALAFVALYVLSVGLFENNIGLIARHRSILFPFLFIMAVGYYYTPNNSTSKQNTP